MIDAITAEKLSGIRLLIVDDNSALAALLVDAFRLAGCDVDAAGDVGATLQLATRHRWSAAVLDIDLPDGNGLELLQTLRAGGPPGGLPAVFITGRPDAARVRQVAALGHALLLPKPFDRREITAAVALLLTRAAAANRAGKIGPA
ncbi:MAG: hypothetical protein C0518_06270 [Opitutus sp.]|nr:hypothetical protein [Opitutus sp.]